MKFGLFFHTGVAGTDPATLQAIARHADDLGFELFYVPEHVTLFPGARVGDHEFPADLPIADPLTCLAFVAASTTRILLGTGVLLLPFHHPVVLAKSLATIDVLSNGRMRLFTIGVGSLPQEAASVGIDYASRGRRADEAIDVLRALWAGDASGTSFSGEFYSFEHATSFPKPLQMLPIHIGGSSTAAARRAGRRGDGFFPDGQLTPAERARRSIRCASPPLRGSQSGGARVHPLGVDCLGPRRRRGVRSRRCRSPDHRPDPRGSGHAAPSTRGLRHPPRAAALTDLHRNRRTARARMRSCCPCSSLRLQR